MVSTSTWHAAGRGSILGLACYIRCNNLALTIRDCVSLVGCGSSVFGAPLRNLGKFVYPTLPASFGRDTISRWYFLYLVSMPVEVKYPTQGVKLMCNLSCTPHSSLEKDNSLNHSCVSPRMVCLEYLYRWSRD